MARPASPAEPNPYVVALRLLAARDLTVRQLDTRLRRRGFSPEDVAAVLRRLQAERALDDERVARAQARTQATVKLRGPARARLELQERGIDRDTARRAVAETYSALDEAALVDRALSRRVKGRIRDAAEFRRAYAYLMRQGFASAAAFKALKARAAAAAVPEDL